VPQLFCHLVTVHEAETEFFSRLLDLRRKEIS